jgi:hypothetical protein
MLKEWNPSPRVSAETSDLVPVRRFRFAQHQAVRHRPRPLGVSSYPSTEQIVESVRNTLFQPIGFGCGFIIRRV